MFTILTTMLIWLLVLVRDIEVNNFFAFANNTICKYFEFSHGRRSALGDTGDEMVIYKRKSKRIVFMYLYL